MKKLLLIAFLAVTAFTGCKKDDEATIDSAKLQGRWDLTKEYFLDKANGVKVDEGTENHVVGEFYITFSGSTYKTYDDGDIDDQGTFTLSGNQITIKNANNETHTATLTLTSENQFVLKDTQEETYQGTKFSYYSEQTFARH